MASTDIDVEHEWFIFERSLPDEVKQRLYEHQRAGVRWLHSLHFHPSAGGILGDDMGLGKTLQVTALLLGLMRQKQARRVLIVAPVSVIASWKRELHERLLPNVTHSTVIVVSSDMPKKKRQITLRQVFAFGHCQIVVTSYQLLASMRCVCQLLNINLSQLKAALLSTSEDYTDQTGCWDYVILDEGHCIKNPTTKISKAVGAIPSKHRLILTGTPIQNNLKEFYELVHFATGERVLGSAQHFKMMYSNPIVAGQDPEAGTQLRLKGQLAAQKLIRAIQPVYLQRKKTDTNLSEGLPGKQEFVVWIPLSSSQREIYEQYISQSAVTSRLAASLDTHRVPVEIINHLKTICRHPLLLEAGERVKAAKAGGRLPQVMSEKAFTRQIVDGGDEVNSLTACMENIQIDEEDQLSPPRYLSGPSDYNAASLSVMFDEDGDLFDCEVDDRAPSPGNAAQEMSTTRSALGLFGTIARVPDMFEILQGSVKMRLLLDLVAALVTNGHRLLIFSQSRLMLDVIQHALRQQKWESCRIDGSTPAGDRQRIIDAFNHGGGADICLLSTKACGTGITLTGADRVIVFDPSWNPAEDRQAVDRAYRIGQTRPVIVYRLIMAGSVEEKMYEKQVFKDGLRVLAENGGDCSRYFSSKETSDLFTLGPVGRSLVMEKLQKLADGIILGLPEESLQNEVEGERSVHYSLGLTRHDTLYTECKPTESLVESDDDVNVAQKHKEDMALVRVQDIQRNAARARMAPKPTGRINSNGLSLRKPIQTAPPPSIAPRGPLIDLTLDVASSNEDQFVAGQCPTTFERDRLTRLRLMRSRESRASTSSEEWPDTAAPDSVLTVQDSPLLSIRNPSEEMVTTPQPIQSAIQSQIGIGTHVSLNGFFVPSFDSSDSSGDSSQSSPADTGRVVQTELCFDSPPPTVTRHRGGTRSRQTGTVGRQGCIDDTEADINLLQLQMMGLCTASPLTDGPGPVNSRIASSPIVPTISGRLEDGADEREASWVDGTPSPPRAQLLNRLRKVRDVIQNTTVAGQSHAKTGGEGLRRRAKMVLSDSEVDEPGCVGCPLNELSDCESENADISSCSECSSVSDALPCVDDEAKDAETDSDVLDDNSVDESSSVECVSVSAGSLKRLCLGVAMAGAADPRRMPFSSKELDENDAGLTNGKKLRNDCPAFVLSGSEQKAYNDLLAQVSKLENELMQCKLYVKANGSDILPQRTRQDALATVQRSLHKIVPLCIQALELCDEDINLHRKLYCYSQLIDA